MRHNYFLQVSSSAADLGSRKSSRPAFVFNERVKYEFSNEESSEETTMVTEIRPMPAGKAETSETARALNELGIEYNEYMDDTDLLSDESNDEVIPPFREEAFEHDDLIPPFRGEAFEHDEVVPESDFFSARAIPSKSGVFYQDSQVVSESLETPTHATSRQGKKAPLPHHYEPSTIVGITIGAFLLIFIGTGD